jgi:methylmalonyl-CoA/ethylmalonyl-CoA epimerase
MEGNKFLYRKIDHIGIAVRSLDAALKTYGAGLGMRADHIEEVPEQKTRVALIQLGESRLELLEAMEEDSPIGRFIAKRGEGLHHLCFQVEDLERTLLRLKEAGVRLIDEIPRRGAGNCLVAFIHPTSTCGVLVELSQNSL